MFFSPKVNAVNCNTSWKITLFMKFSSYRDDVLKGVSMIYMYIYICILNLNNCALFDCREILNGGKKEKN